MEKLIKALQILMKYKNESYPTTCEHEVMYVVGFDDIEVSKEDVTELNELGFEFDGDIGSWYSFKYGSA